MLAAPCARVLLLALCASAATGEALLKSWQLSVDGDTRGGLVAESWGTSRVDYLEERDASGTFVGVKVRGNNRLFSVNDYVWAHKWRDVSYKHWKLLNRALTFTLDLSGVGCGCNAAIYLVAMSEPEAERSGYCDIQSGYDDDFDSVQPCLEIDLLEGMWAVPTLHAHAHVHDMYPAFGDLLNAHCSAPDLARSSRPASRQRQGGAGDAPHEPRPRCRRRQLQPGNGYIAQTTSHTLYHSTVDSTVPCFSRGFDDV